MNRVIIAISLVLAGCSGATPPSNVVFIRPKPAVGMRVYKDGKLWRIKCVADVATTPTFDGRPVYACELEKDDP